ncbi:MAG TPA: alpha/beta fold hydrolase [Chthonomonadaceae bacterium]|nr:alpha/beta fold hydrolase [Chthonomonadaceae bacterium]
MQKPHKHKHSAPEAQNRPLLSPGVVTAAAALAGAGLALGALAYTYLAIHPPRRRIRRTPAELGLDYEDIAFPSRDGLQIRGWLIPAPAGEETKAVVVLCHGYPTNRVEMLPYVRMLHEAGYATLLFDFRALGESEGDLCSIGHYEVEDLRGALDYLQSRPDTRALPYGALGLSLGGAVSLMTAAEDARLRAVVAEASYPSLQHAIEARCRFVAGPFAKTVVRSLHKVARRWIDFHPGDVAPLEVIGRISPRAVLLIQGQRDPQVRWRDAVRMYEAAGEPREIWLLPRSGHARCLRDAPQEYACRVTAFFQKYLTYPPRGCATPLPKGKGVE